MSTTASVQPFKAYVPGFVHIDVKYLLRIPDEITRRYRFVAIDRFTRWVYTEVRADKSSRSARAFLNALHAKAPFRIQIVLTDKGQEFTDRLFGRGSRSPSGEHEFDRLCEALGIERRLTRPRTQQTNNGMIERFNGRIADVLRTHRFQSGKDLETTGPMLLILRKSGGRVRCASGLGGVLQ